MAKCCKDFEYAFAATTHQRTHNPQSAPHLPVGHAVLGQGDQQLAVPLKVSRRGGHSLCPWPNAPTRDLVLQQQVLGIHEVQLTPQDNDKALDNKMGASSVVLDEQSEHVPEKSIVKGQWTQSQRGWITSVPGRRPPSQRTSAP